MHKRRLDRPRPTSPTWRCSPSPSSTVAPPPVPPRPPDPATPATRTTPAPHRRAQRGSHLPARPPGPRGIGGPGEPGGKDVLWSLTPPGSTARVHQRPRTCAATSCFEPRTRRHTVLTAYVHAYYIHICIHTSTHAHMYGILCVFAHGA